MQLIKFLFSGLCFHAIHPLSRKLNTMKIDVNWTKLSSVRRFDIYVVFVHRCVFFPFRFSTKKRVFIAMWCSCSISEIIYCFLRNGVNFLGSCTASLVYAFSRFDASLGCVFHFISDFPPANVTHTHTLESNSIPSAWSGRRERRVDGWTHWN